ncbi:MAG: PPC domain-containing DNA-binding protein [Candidatus Altimarinota bacterium]
MKEILKNPSHRILLFEAGEEIMAGLKAYAEQELIQSAWVNLLGAADELTLGYYHLQAKSFEKHELREDVEILGVMGNIAWINGEAALHLHGTFGKSDLSVIGGHIFSMKISVVGEVHLQVFDEKIERAMDEKLRLNVFQCGISTV